MLEFSSMRHDVNDHFWACVRPQRAHKVAHCLSVDVVVAGDATHISAVHLLSVTIVSNETSSVELLNDFSDLVKEDEVPCLVIL